MQKIIVIRHFLTSFSPARENCYKMKTTQFTIKNLTDQYPTDNACLDKIFSLRFGKMEACPKCGCTQMRCARVKKGNCYECKDCLNQIYPLAGTVYEGSTTPLTLCFQVIFLFVSSKKGVSGKEIEHQIGVTYKCAWRMRHKVRKLIDEGDIMLQGIRH